ncbi:polysulfide reductase NrfD [Sphingobacterium sp. ML3W]|uniref:Quinol:cytochrome c oxidoreductase quinone-binding subunit 1 n=4 Tax=Sphingobacterium TaxID=28453 RepID=A0A420AIX3_SPHD1|nr:MULTISPECIES: NrfD/PsrC family molybdoenzyme membrane anchor subunit [Sphingobacterium]MCS4228160.1 molybdopterin-containing oxidoreductase family membrane subunit [Sphingobacterium sp. BIGb0165]NPE46503.1 polysulfide reductase NrfD [Sphingobacterium prati]OOG16840.1 hydrogenase [Sphingobacterium sp. CZ-UAM]PUV22350.1 hydrogenase [Sphingobacterium athyrii]QIH32102.1 polysulfide reductase NrfD [Sphingobacterium sp. DR205]
MSSHNESILREPLMTGKDITYAKITDDILLPVENKPNKAWWIGFTVAVLGALLWVVSVSYTFWTGIGAWGLNKTVGWAWDITDFVWWVGIGHAGTLISAVLLIFRQNWRNSINRSAEAMTIFAVICAATYVVAHMGRPWLAYWIFPLPNQFGSLWVNFNSPLVWDAFAISTYFTVSLVFWYCGLLPDIATIRDRATGLKQKIYSVLSFGWNGSVKTWQRFEIVSLILAGISTPLVLSVHTIVSMDFATSVIPGWHTTIFPPYFVAGAIFSGFAMVQTLLLILRKVMNFENYITMFHIESMNIIIMTTGSIVGVAYLTELFIAMYSRSEYEMYAFENRMLGPYAWAYWSMMTCNVISPQLFWFKKIRTSIPISWILSIVVNIGMWFERFVIIVTSLHRDYLPSSWAMFYPTWTDVGIFVGSIGLFFTLFLLFLRFLPGIAIAEVKLLLKSSSLQHKTKLAQEGAFPAEQVEYFQESLEKYDSVTEEEIKELSVRK